MPTALVTGASRGVGAGMALGLLEAGYRVFATGRSIAKADLPGEVTRITCDHLDDNQTVAAFETVGAEIDVLANVAWGGYERMVEDGDFTWGLPFWDQPLHRWTSMMDAGVRAAFVASQHAARRMVPAKRGLIVNIGFWAAQKRIGNTLYGVSKAATDKLTADMAIELAPHGVAVVSLYPGLVRTEAVLEAAKAGVFSLDGSESPQFLGRVTAALAADPELMARTGQVIVAAAAARDYGITDIDGQAPKVLTLADV